MSSGMDLTWSFSGHTGILAHLVLESPELSTPVPVLTMGSRLGNQQPRTLSLFRQPNRPHRTNNAKSWGWGVAWHLEQLFLTALSCLRLPGETCLAQPIPRRCLCEPLEPRNTLLGKHVPEINSILASSQEQEHSRAVSMTEGQMQPGLSWTQQPWPTVLRVHRLLQQGVQGG